MYSIALRKSQPCCSFSHGTPRYMSLWSRVKDFWTVVRTDYDQTPKGIRESKDLKMAILAHTHRSLRKQHPQKPVDQVLEDAITSLEEAGKDELLVRAMRYELQKLLAPEVFQILETFQRVDGRLSLAHEAQKILLQEYRNTLVALKNPTPSTSEYPGSEPFHRRKLGALSTLLSFHGWRSTDAEKDVGQDSDESTTTSFGKSDDFGFVAEGERKNTVDAIRDCQTKNMCRSALIREELGHSVISLKSTIPGAGRGVFLDGKAMEGSLVAFIPGLVLPKEYLTSPSAAIDDYLRKDDNFQLSLRSDDILIDSRQSPYTVLDQKGSNPWAIGHIINHPPPRVIPNCRTAMIDFTEPMNLKSTGLLRYVPNSYKRSPHLLGPKLVERDRIIMHGMAIMTRRDVANEELFYDYKFTGDEHPNWYRKATYEEWADERDYEEEEEEE